MKKVAQNIKPEEIVLLKNINPTRIYAFISSNNVYKLHSMSNYRYAFIDMDNSNAFASGFSDSIDKELEKQLEKDRNIYEFDSQKEFAQWMVDTIKD